MYSAECNLLETCVLEEKGNHKLILESYRISFREAILNKHRTRDFGEIPVRLADENLPSHICQEALPQGLFWVFQHFQSIFKVFLNGPVTASLRELKEKRTLFSVNLSCYYHGDDFNRRLVH